MALRRHATPLPFPRARRIKQGRDFLRAKTLGRRLVCGCLILNWLPLPAAPASRLGAVTSRKIGNAVARNRARRRLREAARSVLPRVAVSGHDYVLIGRTETLTRPFPLLIADIEGALRRLGAHSESSPGAHQGRTGS